GIGGGAHFEGRDASHGIHHGTHAFVDGAEDGVVADEPQTAVSEAIEIIDDLFDAAAVVHANVGDVGARSADVVEDYGDAAVVEFVDQLGRHFGDDGGEAGDTAANHQADAGDQLLGAVVGVGDDDFEAAGVGVRFDGLIDVEEKGVLHVG